MLFSQDLYLKVNAVSLYVPLEMVDGQKEGEHDAGTMQTQTFAEHVLVAPRLFCTVNVHV
jgi:hypothetical protein